MAASSKEATGEREPGLFVKQGSKLHAKLLSKEAAAQLAVPSFRVYYSVASAGAVPFLWESQPGTPKNDPASASALPPLTPPPSYYAAGGRKGGGGRSDKRRGGGAAAAIFTFLRRPGRTAPCSASPSSTSTSTTSSSRSTMSPVFTVRSPPPGAAGSRGRHDRRGFSAGEVDVVDAADEEEARCSGTTTSTEAHECCDRGIVKGSRVLGAVRNALATVVGGANKPAARRA